MKFRATRRGLRPCCVHLLLLAAPLGAGCANVDEEPTEATSEGVDVRLAAGESIASAIHRARPGDRVLVPAGVYAGGGWIERSGTAAAPITVVSADGPRRAVIEGGGESLRVGGSAYLTFDGFEVRNSGDNAVHVDGSHHITLRNLYVHDAGVDGDVVKVNQSHHVVVELSELARPGRRTSGPNPSQECLDFVDVDDGAVRDNFIHDGGSMLAFVKGGSRNTVIERNVFSQQRAGASDPAVGLGGDTDSELLQGEQFEAIHIVFRNNVVMNAVQGAVAVYDAQGAYLANNLFLNNDRVVVEFRAGNGPAHRSEDVRAVNNLFVDTRGRMPTPWLRSSDALTGLSTSYNTYWNNGAALPATALFTLSAQPGHLATNPLVTAPAATANRSAVLATVRPATGSPATATGTSASTAPFGVVDDIGLLTRGAARDRGPFLLAAVAGTGTGTSTGTGTGTGTTTTTPTTPTVARVTSVSFGTSAAGVVGRATTITAQSTGSASPRYRFSVRDASGAWTQPCGDYGASRTCAFTPTRAGTWMIQVWARDAASTAQYDATSGNQGYYVTASPTTYATCPPEATTVSSRGEPRNAAGNVRYCWPGEAHCYCDTDNDCYAQSGYVACR